MDNASQQSTSQQRDFQPHDLVRHLWRRRLFIVVIPVVAFIVAWAGANATRGTTYESRASVLVRTLPRMSAEDRTPGGYHPPAFRAMFLADATLDRVRREHGSDTPIEAWRGRFSAITSTEVDTTVATEYAPTVELRARGGSPREAAAIMNLWAEAIMEQYGDLYADEAQATSQRAARRAEELAAQYARVIAEEETHRLRHQSTVARADSIARLLDGALPPARDLLPDTLAPYGFVAGAVPPERQTEVQSEDAPSLFLTRLLNDVRGLPPDEQVTALRDLQEETLSDAALAAGQLAAASAKRLRLEHALRTNASAAAQTEARFPLADRGEAPHGTLRILAPTVEPGGTHGRAPHITALLAAMLVLVLTGIVFAAEAYVRFSVDDR